MTEKFNMIDTITEEISSTVESKELVEEMYRQL